MLRGKKGIGLVVSAIFTLTYRFIGETLTLVRSISQDTGHLPEINLRLKPYKHFVPIIIFQYQLSPLNRMQKNTINRENTFTQNHLKHLNDKQLKNNLHLHP